MRVMRAALNWAEECTFSVEKKYRVCRYTDTACSTVVCVRVDDRGVGNKAAKNFIQKDSGLPQGSQMQWRLTHLTTGLPFCSPLLVSTL